MAKEIALIVIIVSLIIMIVNFIYTAALTVFYWASFDIDKFFFGLLAYLGILAAAMVWMSSL